MGSEMLHDATKWKWSTVVGSKQTVFHFGEKAPGGSRFTRLLVLMYAVVGSILLAQISAGRLTGIK